MLLERRRQAMLQLHLSDREFCCLLRGAYIRDLTVYPIFTIYTSDRFWSISFDTYCQGLFYGKIRQGRLSIKEHLHFTNDTKYCTESKCSWCFADICDTMGKIRCLALWKLSNFGVGGWKNNSTDAIFHQCTKDTPRCPGENYQCSMFFFSLDKWFHVLHTWYQIYILYYDSWYLKMMFNGLFCEFMNEIACIILRWIVKFVG